MNVFAETADELAMQAMLSNSIVVSFSGGKDSLVVLDLCRRVFKKVVCFFMYFVPGLEIVERQLNYAREKWKVEILQYPHWLLIKCLKNGFYCPNYYIYDDIPDLKLSDIWDAVMQDTNINVIAHGAKASDSRWRKWNLRQEKSGNIIYPIKNWNKFDVLAYLKMNDIPIPDTPGITAGGIDLSTPSLLWLHDNNPTDFKKLCEIFPYAEAVIYRREWYGVK